MRLRNFRKLKCGVFGHRSKFRIRACFPCHLAQQPLSPIVPTVRERQVGAGRRVARAGRTSGGLRSGGAAPGSVETAGKCNASALANRSVRIELTILFVWLGHYPDITEGASSSQVVRRWEERREVQMTLFTEELECLERSEKQYQVRHCLRTRRSLDYKVLISSIG